MNRQLETAVGNTGITIELQIERLVIVLVGIGLSYNPARNAAYLDPMVVVRFELFRVCALGSWVIGANMQLSLIHI